MSVTKDVRVEAMHVVLSHDSNMSLFDVLFVNRLTGREVCLRICQTCSFQTEYYS
jgi:hypothetical protein